MSVLSAQSIRRRVYAYLEREMEYWEATGRTPPRSPRNGELLIEPFVERSIAYGRSYGLSSCGYDIRIAQDLILWPFWGRKSFAIEYMALPADLRGTIENKSTHARVFVDASQGTNIEPGWRGHLTLELTRSLPWPIRLRRGMPIAQVVFQTLDEPTEQPYGGKYQDQPAAVVPALLEAIR
jgi:dCTP deaminase